jgi:hypothetical protein
VLIGPDASPADGMIGVTGGELRSSHHTDDRLDQAHGLPLFDLSAYALQRFLSHTLSFDSFCNLPGNHALKSGGRYTRPMS